jgi:tRNA-modifying protein YgfZ
MTTIDAGSGGTADPADAYAALHTSAGVALVPRDVVRVTGPDAEGYLQGQCSQDVGTLTEGDSLESLLLSPQGKIDVYLRITRERGDRFILDTDGGFGPVVVARLERFRLRTKVEFETLDWVCAAVRGPRATSCLRGHPELVVPVLWEGLEGVDLLGPPSAGGVADWVDDSALRCPAGAWEAARIEAGIPVNGRELTDGTIAAEVGLVDRTVSFTKGCFTGQELVARLDARGSNVARRLRAVVLTDDSLPTDRAVASLVGSTVLTADGEHEVGHVSSAARSPGRRAVVALATLHRRVEPPAEVAVTSVLPDGTASRQLVGQALALPLLGPGQP